MSTNPYGFPHHCSRLKSPSSHVVTTLRRRPHRSTANPQRISPSVGSRRRRHARCSRRRWRDCWKRHRHARCRFTGRCRRGYWLRNDGGKNNRHTFPICPITSPASAPPGKNVVPVGFAKHKTHATLLGRDGFMRRDVKKLSHVSLISALMSPQRKTTRSGNAERSAAATTSSSCAATTTAFCG